MSFLRGQQLSGVLKHTRLAIKLLIHGDITHREPQDGKPSSQLPRTSFGREGVDTARAYGKPGNLESGNGTGIRNPEPEPEPEPEQMNDSSWEV